jgi:peptidoglycan/LPS O-acetylase OafA/YrhL
MILRMRVDSWADYRATRRWPQLDGLRSVSILMVLASHMHDPMWNWIRGGRGVTLFFVISGFLITTLLLREEERTGAVSLRGFYIRRIFRIVPLYAAALLLATVLVLGLGLGEGTSNFTERLPLLATFNGEFAGTGTFSHSWSLGIEEKFYVIWPLLIALPLARRRLGGVLAVLVPVAAIAAFVPGVGYFGIYAPIVTGCALAVVMHYEPTYAFVQHLARPQIARGLRHRGRDGQLPRS